MAIGTDSAGLLPAAGCIDPEEGAKFITFSFDPTLFDEDDAVRIVQHAQRCSACNAALARGRAEALQQAVSTSARKHEGQIPGPGGLARGCSPFDTKRPDGDI